MGLIFFFVFDEFGNNWNIKNNSIIHFFKFLAKKKYPVHDILIANEIPIEFLFQMDSCIKRKKKRIVFEFRSCKKRTKVFLFLYTIVEFEKR